MPYVPDTGLAELIRLVRADKHMRAVPLTTEAEAAALAVGAGSVVQHDMPTEQRRESLRNTPAR